MRAVAVVAMACLLGSGCSAIVRKPSGKTVFTDVSLGVTAALVVSHRNCLATSTADLCYGTGMTAGIIGFPLLVVGLLTGAHALASETADAEAEPLETTRVGGEPTSALVVHTPELPALPDIPTDDVTLRMARQARAAAAREQCTSARVTMAKIAQRDPAYHEALAKSAALEPCR